MPFIRYQQMSYRTAEKIYFFKKKPKNQNKIVEKSYSCKKPKNSYINLKQLEKDKKIKNLYYNLKTTRKR